MAAKARTHGEGTVYEETDTRRRTTHRAERIVDLPDGRRVRLSARGRNATDALRKLSVKAEALQRVTPDAAKLTIAQLCRQWLEHKKPQVKPITYAEYKRILERWVFPTVGDIRVADFKPKHAQLVINGVYAGKSSRTPQRGMHTSANNARRYLRMVFTQAQRWEIVRDNPLQHIPAVKRPVAKRSVWEPEEVRKVLAWAEVNQPPVIHALIHTAVFTGLRKGELLALAPGSVTNRGVLVERTMSRGAEGGIGTPKSLDGTRLVPVTDPVRQVMQRVAGDAFVFPSPSGGMLDPRGANRRLDQAADGAGVKRIRFHDLRRTAATLWARQGVPPKVIQKLMGHSTPALALAVYTDVMEGQIESSALDPEILKSGGSNGGNVT